MSELLLRLLREGLYLALLVSAPALLASLAASVVVSALQAVTQLQDASIGAAPRVLAVSVALLAVSPWMGAQLVRFGEAALALLPALAR